MPKVNVPPHNPGKQRNPFAGESRDRARAQRRLAKAKRKGKVIAQASGTERIGMGRDRFDVSGLPYHGQKFQKPGRFKKRK